MKKIIVISLLVLMGVVIISCSQAPSQDIIKQAINVCWIDPRCSSCGEAQVKSIEIKQIGEFNKQGNYWPVKCKIIYSGHYGAWIPGSPGDNFDEIIDIKLFQDDFKKWKAGRLKS